MYIQRGPKIYALHDSINDGVTTDIFSGNIILHIAAIAVLVVINIQGLHIN